MPIGKYKRKDPRIRFQSLVEADSQLPGGCWIWKGRHLPSGYGHYGKTTAHRRSWEIFVGGIPKGLEIDHLCRVRNCVNPYHLEPVTKLENARRRTVLKTHCKLGHPYDYFYKNSRDCLTCRRVRSMRFYTSSRAPS